MTELVPHQPQSGALVAQTRQELIRVLGASLYPGAAPASIALVLDYCAAARLDPFQKPVHIVPMYDSKTKSMRDVIMPGVNLYRTQASRTGEFAGMSEPEFGPDVTETIGGLEITYPQWARVTAKRLMKNGQIAEFTAVERWRENYAVKGGPEKSIAPNAMWQKRPAGQLGKCAQAQALRLAFPELASAPTADEMEGKPLHDDIIDMQPPTPAVPADLVEGGDRTAGQGTAALEKWWKAIGKPARQQAASMLDGWRATAAAFDTAAASKAATDSPSEIDDFVAAMDRTRKDIESGL